ncbi:MAG: ribokinase [Leifsonia sp.]
MPGRLAVVGSANVDIGVQVEALPRAGETVIGRAVTESPGGKGANSAVAAALLGGDVSFVGAVGDDVAGRTIRESLRRAGVSDVALESLPGASGMAFIELDDAGENRIIVVPGANDSVRIGPSAASEIAAASVTLLSLETPVGTATKAARIAARAGGRVVLNLSPFRKVPDELMSHVDVLVVNEHEAASLFGVREVNPANLSEHAVACARLGVNSIIVTLGGEGALLVSDVLEPQTEHAPGIRARVTDTTGCGDAFVGAVAMSLAHGAELAAAVRLGTRVGAFAAEGRGAQSSYPTRSQLESWSAEPSLAHTD